MESVLNPHISNPIFDSLSKKYSHVMTYLKDYVLAV